MPQIYPQTTKSSNQPNPEKLVVSLIIRGRTNQGSTVGTGVTLSFGSIKNQIPETVCIPCKNNFG